MNETPKDTQACGQQMAQVPRRPHSTLLGLCAVAAISAAAAAMIFRATGHGAGISPDATRYVEMARNFAGGYGFSTYSRFSPGELAPERHWPPFYPLLLSIAQWLGCDAVVAARWLGALLFAANVFLIGFAIYRYTSAAWLAAIGSLIAATSSGLLLVHYFAWSEPPFILLTVLSLLTMSAYAAQPRLLPLVLSAVAAALMLITRQAGLAVLVTGAAVIFMGRARRCRRVGDAVLFFAISGLPLGLWMLRNALTTGAPLDRPFGFHPISVQIIRDGLMNISGWFLPDRAPDWARWTVLSAAVAGLIGVAVLYAKRKPSPKPAGCARLLAVNLPLLALYVAVYAVMMIAVISFVDPPIFLEPRILMPAFVPLLVLVLCAAYEATTARPLLRLLLALACVMCVIENARYAPKWISIRHHAGWGFESKAWAESPTIAYLRALPRSTAIYSNMESAPNFLLGRGTACIPAISGSYPLADPRDFRERVGKMRQNLLKPPGGVVVYFAHASGSYQRIPTPQELMEFVPLEAAAQFSDGTVFRPAR